jgi:hypothetical protein
MTRGLQREHSGPMAMPDDILPASPLADDGASPAEARANTVNAADDRVEAAVDRTLAIAVADLVINDSDPEGDAFTLLAVGGAPAGAVTMRDAAAVAYTPPAGFVGTDSFTYTVSDGAAVREATATITVVDGSPIAEDDALIALAGRPLAITPARLLANDRDPQGSPLSVTGVDTTGLAGTLARDNATGTLTFTSSAGFLGATSFRYGVSDGVNGDDAIVTITVRATNARPVGREDAFATEEGRSLVIPAAAVLANDSDADGDALAIVRLVQPDRGTVAFDAAGNLVYTPRAGLDGVDTFLYVVSDGIAETEAKVSLTVVEGTPIARNDLLSSPANMPLTIPKASLLANDIDPQGTPLVVSVLDPAGLRGTIRDAGSTVIFTPEAGFKGDTSFRYTASDGANSDTATVTIRVTNEDPRAQDDRFTLRQDLSPHTLDVLANDIDGDGQALAITRVAQAANGTVSIVNGTVLTYTPNPGFTGTDSFTYDMTDGVSVDQGRVTVEIFSVRPIVRDDVFDTVAETEVSFLLADVLANDTDPLGGALRVTVFDVDAADLRGTLTLVNFVGTFPGLVPTFIFLPERGFKGETSFTYNARNAELRATGTVTIRVTNDEPTARNDAASVEEGRSVSINVLANDSDPEGRRLELASIGQPANGTASIGADGTILYTPRAGFAGTDVLSYFVSDGIDRDEAEVVITVVEGSPIARTDTIVIGVDRIIAIDAATLLANDSDPQGAPLTVTGFNVSGLAGTVSDLSPAGGFTFTPEPGFRGDTTFRYTVSDGANTSTGTGIIRLSPDVPRVANDDAYTIQQGRSLNLGAPGILANDIAPGGTPLSLIGITGVANGSLQTDPFGAFLYQPDAAFTGTEVLTYRVTDGSAEWQATVTVTVVASVPVAGDDILAVAAGLKLPIAAAMLLANDSDPEGDALTITGTDTTGLRGTLVADGTGFVFTPAAGFKGDTSFLYTVSDGLQTDTAIVTIRVTNDNSPSARDDGFAVEENRILTANVLANDSDADGQALRVTGHGAAANGVLTIAADGTLTYTPNQGFVGTETVRYSITDGLEVDQGTITITVAEGTPLAREDAFTARHGVPLLITDAALLANDSDPQGTPLSITGLDTAGLAGTLTRGAGSITFTPDVGFGGATAFRYTVSDGANNATGTVRLSVPTPPPAHTFGFSNGSRNQGEAPEGAAGAGGGLVAVAADPATGTLIEAVGIWNSVKNAITGLDAWAPVLGADITVANFVDVRLDLGNAGATALDVTVLGAKRGTLETAGGDDAVAWFFHSNEGTWSNLAVIETGGGNDTILASTVARTAADDALLADNASPGNGPLWIAAYDGRFSLARIDAGAGNDTIVAEARVRLEASGGAGNDSITGGFGNDVIVGGDNNDILAGRGGADRFRFDGDDGSDIIADFSRAQGDRVVLEGPGTLALSGASFTFGTTTVTAANGHAWAAADFILA